VTIETMSEVERNGRPLLFVDIAVPRDVAADVALLDHITVLDLDDLKAWAARGRAQRLTEVDHVAEIVAAEVERFTLEASARQAAPLVAALRQRGEDFRRAVMTRHHSRLARLSEADRELIESITRGVVAKLLHEPSVRLRDEAGTPQGERNAAAVADLFDLG
jgi:glutamyl-tRNA reductase